jgi:hypothetical protein
MLPSLLLQLLVLVVLVLARDSTVVLGVGAQEEEEVCTSQASRDETTTTKSSDPSSNDRVVPSSSSSSSSTTTTTTTTRIECDLYLAESTMPGAGLGMFSAVPFQKGQFWGHGDPNIPIIEPTRYYGHPPPYDDDDNDDDDEDNLDVTHDYVWHGESVGMKLEVAETLSSLGNVVTAHWPGVGAAINFHTALNDIGSSLPTYDEAHVHRSTHPGAGAFTPYHLAIPRVLRDIPAGGEVFKDYGNDEWYVCVFV